MDSRLLLDEVFNFEPILGYRRKRIAAIEDVLSSAGPFKSANPYTTDIALHYAVAHHLVEGGERAAIAADRESLNWYLTTASQELHSRSIWGSSSRHLIVAPTTDAMYVTPASDTPYYILDQTDTSPGESLRTLTLEALHTGKQNGFGKLLSDHAPVICLLTERRAGEYLNSWTITRLPGTVYLDYVMFPVIVARDLIHESGHNWLNDALSACEISLKGTGEFYSPWKRTMRPTFGFLHACWAFPLTVIFGMSARSYASGTAALILERYLARQQVLLRETRESHSEALSAITHQGLRDRLQRVYELATAE